MLLLSLQIDFYVAVVRVVAVVGTFESVSTAAAAVVYVVVIGVVAIPARGRPPALNSRKKRDNFNIMLF